MTTTKRVVKKIKPIKDCKTLKELFATKKRWVKHHLALDELDQDVLIPASQKAVKFCLIGGVHRIYDTEDIGEIINRLRHAVRKLFNFNDIVSFNDHPLTTFQRVKKVIKEAKV